MIRAMVICSLKLRFQIKELNLIFKMVPATYYYDALNDSEYSFAFSLLDTDKVSYFHFTKQ